jgi:hypothetical protein
MYAQVGVQSAYYPTMAPQPIYALVHPGSLAPMYTPLQQPGAYAAQHHAQHTQFASRPPRGRAGAHAHHDDGHATGSPVAEHKARASRSRGKADRDGGGGGGGTSKSASGREGVRSGGASAGGTGAGSGVVADEQTSRRMLEFRERKGEYELEDIIGHVVEFAKDQVRLSRPGTMSTM